MDSPRGASPASNDLDHEHRNSNSSENSLPNDLPKSLDDRRSFPSLQTETEMYDAWQGADNLFLLFFHQRWISSRSTAN